MDGSNGAVSGGELFTASVEHSIYGIVIFTVGLGTYFYHGAEQARLAQHLADAE
ncbi:hypothetical protein OG874_39410 [Nocardia sp. NBC_00565]|uniref:hypothetical protein n=1 Tax=Nocardia sp. NBC_00565 TaxID=2975993 RepID=UPI002E80E70D|nr:hypothetical protein [Nocardia sp. NBC_00565]WUC02708.1 hypothetical protein OG874_39410 [Nocardia sp. NBC_00565]